MKESLNSINQDFIRNTQNLHPCCKNILFNPVAKSLIESHLDALSVHARKINFN